MTLFLLEFFLLSAVDSVLRLSVGEFTVILVLSRLFCQRCCLPVCPLNGSHRPIPDRPAWPPGSLDISEAPGTWWRAWRIPGGSWQRLEIHLKQEKTGAWGCTGRKAKDWKRSLAIDLLQEESTHWRWWNQSRQHRSPWRAWPCSDRTHPEPSAAER